MLPAQMMDIFRDETMTAVFGKPYDALDNGTRIDLFEKVFSNCTGEAHHTAARPPVTRRPFSIGGVNIGNVTLGEPDRPLPPEYRQEFAQYSELIHEAFSGRPGRFEPAAVTRFLQQVRQQIEWANAAIASASSSPATSDAFRQIQENLNQTTQKASMLRADERDHVRAYLGRRESDLAPAIVQAWLASQATAPKTPESANSLLNSRRQMAGVFTSLNQDQQSHDQAAYEKILDSQIAPTLQAATAKLTALRTNWQGAQELGAQEGEFLSHFAQFSSTASYTEALAQFDAARSRLYPAVLPEWRRKVASAQLQSGDIDVLREDLKVLFVSPADRALPLFQQFEQPVRDRQAQLNARVAEDEHRRLVEAERAAAIESRKAAGASVVGGLQSVSNSGGTSASATGLMPKGALKVSGGPDGEVLNAIYEGDFDKVSLDRSSPEFASIGGGYIEGFSSNCLDQLPKNRVELTRTVCDAPWVITNGWGNVVSSGCNASHEEGTGVFADPQLYAALHSTPVQAVGSAMRVVVDMLTKGGDPISGPINMALNMVQLKTDAQNLVAQNGCTSPALRRFKQNLEGFALGKEGLRLDGTVQLGVALLPPTTGTKYRDSDYSRLLDDMVNEQGKTWAINRYIPGSIGPVRVESRDAVGRPMKISADYAYNGFSSRQGGTVTLSFDEGRPACLYFSDQPNSCRTPAHRLTTAYVQGNYR
jgi:hypothetical protein